MNGNNAPAYRYGAYSAWKPRKTKLFERKISDIITAGALVLLSILAVSAVIWDGARLGYTIVFDTIFVAITAFLLKKNLLPGAFPIFCAVLTLVCSWSFAVTSNVTVRFFSFIITFVSSVVWFSSLSGKRSRGGDLSLVKTVFCSVKRGVVDLPGVFEGLFSKNSGRSKTVSYIMIGVVCAVPVLVIVVPLLLRSSAVLSYLVENITFDVQSTILKVVLGIALSVLLIGLAFSIKYKEKEDEKYYGKTVNNVIISSFLFVLTAVYLVYLLSQIVYFFSAFANILPDGYGFTYAGYARNGFFELCVISAIDLAAVFLSIVFSEKKEGKIPFIVKLPALCITIFTLIFIASAVSKMVMYIGVYGMTVLRICTSSFMIWMATVFIAVLIRLFSKKLDVFVTGLVSALVIVSILGVVNVNSFVAKYNYDAHVNDGARADVYYMAALGDEGVEYLCRLANDTDDETSSTAREVLNELIPVYYNVSPYSYETISSERFSKLERLYTGLGAFSFSRENAYRALEEYYK